MAVWANTVPPSESQKYSTVSPCCMMATGICRDRSMSQSFVCTPTGSRASGSARSQAPRTVSQPRRRLCPSPPGWAICSVPTGNAATASPMATVSAGGAASAGDDTSGAAVQAVRASAAASSRTSFLMVCLLSGSVFAIIPPGCVRVVTRAGLLKFFCGEVWTACRGRACPARGLPASARLPDTAVSMYAV